MEPNLLSNLQHNRVTPKHLRSILSNIAHTSLLQAGYAMVITRQHSISSTLTLSHCQSSHAAMKAQAAFYCNHMMQQLARILTDGDEAVAQIDRLNHQTRGLTMHRLHQDTRWQLAQHIATIAQQMRDYYLRAREFTDESTRLARHAQHAMAACSQQRNTCLDHLNNDSDKDHILAILTRIRSVENLISKTLCNTMTYCIRTEHGISDFITVCKPLNDDITLAMLSVNAAEKSTYDAILKNANAAAVPSDNYLLNAMVALKRDHAQRLMYYQTLANLHSPIAVVTAMASQYQDYTNTMATLASATHALASNWDSIGGDFKRLAQRLTRSSSHSATSKTVLGDIAVASLYWRQLAHQLNILKHCFAKWQQCFPDY